MKIRPVGAELFYADGRTDMTKLIGAFRNFANAPKKEYKMGGTCGAHGREIPTELYVEFVTVRVKQGENCERFVCGVMEVICKHVSKRRVSGIGSHKISSVCPPIIYGAKDRRQPVLQLLRKLSEEF
jgi:hypothetical protein